ncbi:hypothetical protein B932_2672 [Gluconobacter oxydans H24]|nr:hypothetical protein B932_2672 [Gluconobacter oxydans H24]
MIAFDWPQKIRPSVWPLVIRTGRQTQYRNQHQTVRTHPKILHAKARTCF